MLAELRTKSQITIPKEIIKKLNLLEGDKLEVYEKDYSDFDELQNCVNYCKRFFRGW